MFELVVFLACRRASPEGPHGPGALARLPYTLEGVTYTWQIDDPAAEPPFAIGEMWFYLRFSRSRVPNFSRRFALRVLAVNDDGSRTRVAYPANPASTRPFPLGNFQFPAHSPVTSLTVVLRDLELPHRGRYEFRLLVERRKRVWGRSRWGLVGSYYLALE
jgi:hypothetical protein